MRTTDSNTHAETYKVEVEADGDHGVTYRMLFAVDGYDGQTLLAPYPLQ